MKIIIIFLFSIICNYGYAQSFGTSGSGHINVHDPIFWGDFAMFEILTPVPPHFNIAYAGWNPNKFNNLIQPENKIILQADNNIQTNQPITILSGADYEFVAGNSII